MDAFNREVQSIEGEAINFIDESFKSLRSAEGAFDLLLNFKHIRSREAINTQMMKKFNDILTQYNKEVRWNISSAHFVDHLKWNCFHNFLPYSFIIRVSDLPGRRDEPIV